MSDETALIIIEKLNPVEIFQNGGMDKILKEIEAKVEGIVFDVSTEEGRKECISTAYRVTRSKTVLDNLGKEYGSDLKKKLDAINADRRKAKNFLEPLAAKVREPVTEWEAEQDRIRAMEERKEKEKVLARIDELQKYGKVLSFFDTAVLTDDEYSAILEQAKADHKAEQKRLADEAAEREAEQKRLAEERAELEKLRAEQEERSRIEREKQEAERRKLEEERRAIEAEKARIAHGEAVKTAAEEARSKAEAHAKAKADEERWRSRLEQLDCAGWNGQEAFDQEMDEPIISYDGLVNLDEKSFQAIRKSWNKKVADRIELREAEAKKEREKAEAAEKARFEKLRPDREKLEAFAQFLQEGVTYPEMSSDATENILLNARKQIYDIGEEILVELENL